MEEVSFGKVLTAPHNLQCSQVFFVLVSEIKWKRPLTLILYSSGIITWNIKIPFFQYPSPWKEKAIKNYLSIIRNKYYLHLKMWKWDQDYEQNFSSETKSENLSYYIYVRQECSFLTWCYSKSKFIKNIWILEIHFAWFCKGLNTITNQW